MAYSPYYEFLLNRNRTVSFMPQGNCTSEIAWYDHCASDSKNIDQPSTQGALYIASCHQDESCYFQIPANVISNYDDNNDEDIVALKDLIEHMTNELEITVPWNKVRVTNNVFRNNQADVLISKKKSEINQP